MRDLGLTGVAVVFSANPVFAADFPPRSIRVVVDNPSGTINDIYARLVGRHLFEALGQAVVIDNRPGATGLVAAEEVLKAAPDGHTILFGGMNTLVALPAMGGRIRFDPKTAFIPIAVGPMGYPLIAASNQLAVRGPNRILSLRSRPNGSRSLTVLVFRPIRTEHVFLQT